VRLRTGPYRARIADLLLHGAAIAVYIAVFSGLLLPVVFSGRLLALLDGPIEALPAFYSPRSLWTPHLLGGFPSAADPIAQSWYPLTLLAYIPQGWNAFVILGFVLLASFTYGYVFAITGCRLAGLASGLVFGLSGVLHSTLALGHLTILHTVMWMPLALWGFERLRHGCSLPWLMVASFAVANACLAGHAQVLLYAMTVLLGYVLASAMADARGR
jgi:hypothetical protein